MTTRRRNRTGEIQWDAVRQRLEAANAASLEALHPTPARQREILEERARNLARALADPHAEAAELELITFTLAHETYGVETRYVNSVVRLSGYTPVPGTPDFLLGICPLRGEILAVIDLRSFFGLPSAGLTDLARIVVLGEAQPELGILADEVHQVTRIPIDAVLEPPDSIAGSSREYLRGVTREALLILDGATLLNDARLYIDQSDAADARAREER